MTQHNGQPSGCDRMPQDVTLRVELSPAQARALAALLGGASVTAAAEAAGVDRATVHRWLRDVPEFQAEYGRGKAELLDAARGELRALAASAVETLRDLLDPEEEDVPPPVRLRAALEVLRMIGADQPEPVGPTTPADAERQNRRRDDADLLDDAITFGASP